jgi:serine/threonine protein kinase
MSNSNGGIPVGSTFKNRTYTAYSKPQRGGYDLRRLLSSEPAPTGVVIPTFLSVIAAIEEVRRENKGPCDLDPRRIFFKDDGTVELSVLPPPGSGMTVVLSSSKYCAPEAVEDLTGQKDSSLVESYVLGFVFYEILLGSNLFEQQFQDVSGHGKFAWLTWHADKSKRAKPLSEVISGFPSVLSSLIEGMMAKESAERITDIRRIAETIGGASQATMMISNLSALQDGDEVYVSRGTSVLEKVDVFWRGLLSAVRSAMRKLSWKRIFARKHKQAHSNAQEAPEFFRRGEAERARSARAYQSPNTSKGSGFER